MKQHYALSLLAGLLASTVMAQPPCLVSFTPPAGPAGQTAVANASFNPPTVPPTMTGQVATTSTAAPNQVTVASTTGLAIGNSVTGPNIPPGTRSRARSVCRSTEAWADAHS